MTETLISSLAVSIAFILIVSYENASVQQLISQLQEKEQDLRKWKERALKVENGFQEIQLLLTESDDLRTILEEKIKEVDHLEQIIESLRNENLALKQASTSQQNYTKDLEYQISQMGVLQSKRLNHSSNYDMTAQLEKQSKEIYQMQNQLESTTKVIRDKDLQLKRLDLQIVEKDNICRQLKRDIEMLNKKNQQKEDDFKREIKILQESCDEKIHREGEEFDNERVMYKRRMQELEQVLSDVQRENDEIKQKIQIIEKDCQQHTKDLMNNRQQNEQLEENLNQLQQRYNHSHISQRNKYGQEIENQRHQYEMHINNLSNELQQFEKMISQQQEQLTNKQLQLNEFAEALNNTKRENEILKGEIELSKEKNIELQRQRSLELELQEGHFKESIEQMILNFNGQTRQLEQQNNQLRHQLEKRTKEVEDLRLQMSEAILKLNDQNEMHKHIYDENEILRSTIHQLQKQKEWEDGEKEEQKKKDIGQLKRYHETLLDQLGRENKSLRLMVEQKNKECEEWRSECLRLKHFLQ